jgi:AraC-like DNA-binding protein
MTMLSALFTPDCRLTGQHGTHVMGLESLEQNYRYTFPHLVDMVPLTREPVRHRSTGWMTGSVGVGIGDHSPIRIQTAGTNGLLLYAPISGQLHVRQDGNSYAAPHTEGWILFNELPAQAETGANCGIIISLQRKRLQATFDVMMGTRSSPVCPLTQVLSLDTPSGRVSVTDLPLLLNHAHAASQDWPGAIPIAEDVVYRFVARLLMPNKGANSRKLRGLRAQHVVDVACGYMLSRINEPMTLTDVEGVVGVGTRSLQQAFLACLGLPPKSWFKEQRLLLAHHLITKGGEGTVSSAAVGCGLNHFGRFAQEFKARFGKTPSELARDAPSGPLH